MMVRTLTKFWAFLLFALGACAAPAGQDGFSGYSDLRINLGLVTTSTIEKWTVPVMQRHAYTIRREELFPSRVYMETAWLARQPFADERALGVLGAETRLIIEAGPVRQGGRMAGLGAKRTVWLVAENVVYMQPDGSRKRLANTPEFRAYVKALARDLRDEYAREEMRL